MGMILMLNRKLHKAYIRTRDFNFSLNGLIGFDLHGKTAGVIGTGKIGRSFIDICRGFGMEVIANDPFPAEGSGIDYVSREELFRRSDIISLHCPLTEDTRYIINEHALSLRRAIGSAQAKTVSIMTGPEGGFSDEEVLFAQHAGLQVCTLGPRILRCETAPLCALSAVLFAAGALD